MTSMKGHGAHNENECKINLALPPLHIISSTNSKEY